MTPLARALVAAKAGDLVTTRTALIEAWRARRSPVVADLVALVEAAAPPDTLSAAIAAIVTPRATASEHNLDALADVDDPRLAGFAIRALVELPFTAPTAQRFLSRLVAVAARHRDPRLVDQFSMINDALRQRIKRAAMRDALLVAVARAVRATPALSRATPRAAELEVALTEALDGLRRSGRRAEALLADIYANPGDDAPRLVYADLLTEAGDPRGEFIALQLARSRDAEPSARELELQKRHGKAWLGALAPVLSWGRGYSGTRFARGFLATADIILSVGPKLRPTYGDPMWSTVERLAGTWNTALLFQAPFRALRTLDSYLDHDDVAILAARTEPLAALEALDVNVGHGSAESLDPALIKRAFPNLQKLSVYRERTTVADLRALAANGIRELRVDHYRHSGAVSEAESMAAFAALRAALRDVPPLFDRFALRPPWTSVPAPAPIVVWPP